jgi:hypothetical protein
MDADELRKAIECEDYAAASKLWLAYCGRVRQEVIAGEAGGARVAEMQEVVAASRLLLLCARAQMLGRLNALHVAGAYGGHDSGPR